MSERADLSSIPAQQQEWPGSLAALDPRPDHGETSWEGRGRGRDGAGVKGHDQRVVVNLRKEAGTVKYFIS